MWPWTKFFPPTGPSSPAAKNPATGVFGIAARAAMPQTPVAGFFAAGELGPVGGKNFVHGHTASIALIRPASTPGRSDT